MINFRILVRLEGICIRLLILCGLIKISLLMISGLLWQAITAMEEESPDVITSVFFPITFLIKSVTSST